MIKITEHLTILERQFLGTQSCSKEILLFNLIQEQLSKFEYAQNVHINRGRSRTTVTSKMVTLKIGTSQLFVRKNSILNIAGVVDSPLIKDIINSFIFYLDEDFQNKLQRINHSVNSSYFPCHTYILIILSFLNLHLVRNFRLWLHGSRK